MPAGVPFTHTATRLVYTAPINKKAPYTVRPPWSRTYQVKCPDGTTRTVYRKIEDAFPLDLRASQTAFSAKAGDALGAMSANIEGEHRDKVEHLLVAIDSKNNTLMVKFRAAYTVFETNPCANDQYLADQVKQLIEMHDRLTEVELGTQSLIALINTKPTETEAILHLFREIVTKLRPASPALNSEAASVAIGEARRDAAKWINPSTAPDDGEAE
jgi:hypothetical protein